MRLNDPNTSSHPDLAQGMPDLGTAIPEFAQGVMALSAGALADRLASTTSSELNSARLMLETGAAPLDDPLHDVVAGLSGADCPTVLSSLRAALVAGPASAVENVEELYEAGLPEGLPGGHLKVSLFSNAVPALPAHQKSRDPAWDTHHPGIAVMLSASCVPRLNTSQPIRTSVRARLTLGPC